MARRQARHKQARRFGTDLHGTGGASLRRRIDVPPGGRPARARRRLSTFARQLLEKQKARALYGVTERQFRRIFDDAGSLPGPHGENLLALLERRLDNVAYRLGFARTRAMARQLVSHGHVLVDGRRVTIPSLRLEPGQSVTISRAAADIPAVAEELSAGRPVPGWLERTAPADGGPGGRVVRQPARDDLDVPIDEAQIVAFYAR